MFWFRMPMKRDGAKSIKDSKWPVIVVKFVSITEKDHLLLVMRNHKSGIPVKNLGYRIDGKVYINESLSAPNQQLRRLANLLRKHNRLTNVFSRNGFIYVETSMNGTPIKVNNAKQLKSIVDGDINSDRRATNGRRKKQKPKTQDKVESALTNEALSLHDTEGPSLIDASSTTPSYEITTTASIHNPNTNANSGNLVTGSHQSFGRIRRSLSTPDLNEILICDEE